MDDILEKIFLVTSVLGFLLSIALITYVFRQNKANFFLGLMVLFISIQLLFSWGSHSGYNMDHDAFPFWIFLTYHIFPPSIWLFTKSIFDQTFNVKPRYAWLFMPAIAEISVHVALKLGIIPGQVNLMNYQAWIWFIDYIPLSGFGFSLGFFWKKYFQISQIAGFKQGNGTLVSHIKSVLLMSVLSLICLLWFIFTLIGWENFSIIEYLLVFLVIVFSFLIFLDSQPFLFPGKIARENSFSHYDDHKQLKRLDHVLLEKQLFVRPNLSLNELSMELKLPSRYISYLINRYHHKNFKGFINDYRIEAFIAKARLPEEKHKTLLALALESGFNSKSTFNQVFKNYTGQSPTDYLS